MHVRLPADSGDGENRMSSVAAVSYQAPITGAQKVSDERTESQSARNAEVRTGKDVAVAAKPAPGTGTIVDKKV
jgi:hypothetical protein